MLNIVQCVHSASWGTSAGKRSQLENATQRKSISAQTSSLTFLSVPAPALTSRNLGSRWWGCGKGASSLNPARSDLFHHPASYLDLKGYSRRVYSPWRTFYSMMVTKQPVCSRVNPLCSGLCQIKGFSLPPALWTPSQAVRSTACEKKGHSPDWGWSLAAETVGINSTFALSLTTAKCLSRLARPCLNSSLLTQAVRIPTLYLPAGWGNSAQTTVNLTLEPGFPTHPYLARDGGC